MKADKLREKTSEELKQQERDLYNELVNLRVQAVLGQVENPCVVRVKRRLLARVKTVLREKELSAA